jgi:tetratricopeptide (TPR) repeat protein
MYYELGITYHKIKKYSYSMDACKKAIGYLIGETKDNEKNGQEPLLLLIKKQQAITFYDGNEVENAKTMFEELMALQRKEYGGSSVIIAETLKYLGDVHVALKDKPQAAKFYNRALHILKKRLGSTDQTVKQLEQYIKQLNLKD